MGVSAELQMPTHMGKGTWATIVIPDLGDPPLIFPGPVW